MLKYKLFKKHFLQTKNLKYGLRTRYLLFKEEAQNIDRIKNSAFLRFLKTFEVKRNNNSIYLMDLLLSFPIEKYTLNNRFFTYIRTKFAFSGKKTIYAQTQEDIPNTEKKINQISLAQTTEDDIILFKFEEEFIKDSIRHKFKSGCLNVNSLPSNSKYIKSNKKISVYKFQNKRDAHSFPEKINKRTNNDKSNSQELKEEKNLTNEKAEEEYYTRLIREARSLHNQFTIEPLSLKAELTFIKFKIREKKIARIKKLLSKMLKIINIKSLLDLKNTKNTIQATFTVLSKYIALYKLSMNELVEGQREVTHNKNFRFEDGQTVKEKIEKFERKLKENVNLSDHYEKKEKQ